MNNDEDQRHIYLLRSKFILPRNLTNEILYLAKVSKIMHHGLMLRVFYQKKEWKFLYYHMVEKSNIITIKKKLYYNDKTVIPFFKNKLLYKLVAVGLGQQVGDISQRSPVNLAFRLTRSGHLKPDLGHWHLPIARVVLKYFF